MRRSEQSSHANTRGFLLDILFNDMAALLLDADELPSFEVLRSDGSSPFVIVVDHASNRIPRKLGNLGLSDDDPHHILESHFAWDIGIAETARLLSELLDAPCVLQNYSRLVIDCNRPPFYNYSNNNFNKDSIISEIQKDKMTILSIPGNQNITDVQREARIREIFQTYQDAIARLLNQRPNNILIALHSFTPIDIHNQQRPMHLGVLYNRDPRLAREILDILRNDGTQDCDKMVLLSQGPTLLVVGENEPYRVNDDIDYAIPIHGEKRGIPSVLLEIRQDCISFPRGQIEWAQRLATVLPRAAARIQMMKMV
jgi:predicted N-formylglutamate amidohydrolase